MNIYVGNLSFDTDDAELERTFTEFGEVTSARVIQDRESGRSRGFGFVEMADNTQAEDRPRGGGGGGGGGGYGGGGGGGGDRRW